MGPETLAQVLRPLRTMFQPADFPDLLVGLEVADDAAVYRITDDLAIIQTLDFFTPIVDDPFDYGAIAAANAMSDVYAMGGEVILALNIAAFPRDLPPEMIGEILRGGATKVAEAGAVLAGGHTIDDDEPKYGLAVMGTAHPQHILTKAGARPGDLLALTKPLGVGIVATAAKGEMADPAHIMEASRSMMRLNREAARIATRVGVHAATDITGFGLLGHGTEMAEMSGVRLRFVVSQLPFVPGARLYAQDWLFPAGTCANERFYAAKIAFGPGVSEEMRQLLYTPETSGGLLMAVDPGRVGALTQQFESAGQPFWLVGTVIAGQGIEVVE